VFEERRKRGMDPILSLLKALLLDTPANDQEQHVQDKLKDVHDLLESITKLSSELPRLSPEKLDTLMKLGSDIGKVLDIKDKLLKRTNE
jgi:DNA-binding transcriptional regulator GbsR (MarR family)